MDALKFFKERMRMCDYYNGAPDGCTACPRNNKGCELSTYRSCDYVKEYITDVEKWSKKHPQKTRLQDFRKKYPNATIYDNGIPKPCCSDLGYCKGCTEEMTCDVCWNMPMEEDE